MNTTTNKSSTPSLSTLLRTSLVVISLAALSGCGQKGPLILEQVPVDATQAPTGSAGEQVPVVAPAPTED